MWHLSQELIKIRKQFSVRLARNGSTENVMVPQLKNMKAERLVDEDDNILWECIICEIAEMASKFPSG